MAGRNWRDEERYRDDYWREGARTRPGYEGSDYYGRSRSYEGGDWGSDRGGGPGDYGRDFSRDVRRDSYGERGYGGFQANNPFPSNRSFDYDDSNHPASRGYRRDPSRSGEWDRRGDYGRERGGAFWNSDADDRRDWELNRRSWSGRDHGRGYGDERGFFDRASDEVASWFGDEDAERRRRQDHHRGRGPRNYTRSQDRIREDVSDRLTDDWSVDASDIEVTVSGTEVTLSGTVTSRDQRRRAEDIAERVSGVTHVQNNVRVKPRGPAWSGSDTFAGAPETTSGGSGFGTLGSPGGNASATGMTTRR